jgi:sialic acid synthase SpsE
MPAKPISLPSGFKIGPGNPCFIVAEVGNNHQGKLELAREMVIAAAEAGVNGVKFQKRDVDALLNEDGKRMPYTGPNSFGPTYGEHRLALELTTEEMAELRKLTHKLGMTFFASAWDHVSVGHMQQIGWDVAKICSADLVNIPMLRQIGAMNIPVILSTGMSTWEQVDRAVAELRKFHDKIVLLHCNSSYPCPEDEIGLPIMDAMAERYGLLVGYSGHERGFAPTLAAVARGACVVERHVTLNKNLPGTDHQVSLEPDQLKELVTLIREVERAMQVKEKQIFAKESQTAAKLRKSIVAARNIPAGTLLTEEDLTVKSPGTGLSPLMWDDVVGRRLTCALAKDAQLQTANLES